MVTITRGQCRFEFILDVVWDVILDSVYEKYLTTLIYSCNLSDACGGTNYTQSRLHATV